MKLTDITQIKQTNNEAEANELLAKGFRLLKILSNRVPSEFGDEIKPIYILGLVKEQ